MGTGYARAEEGGTLRVGAVCRFFCLHSPGNGSRDFRGLWAGLRGATRLDATRRFQLSARRIPTAAIHPRGITVLGESRSPALWVAAVLAILLVGVMIGFFVARGQTSGDTALLAETRDELGQLQRALAQSEDRNWAYYRANEVLRAELEEAASGRPDTTTSSVAGQSSGVFRDGVYLVGEDIAAGTYDGVVRGENRLLGATQSDRWLDKCHHRQRYRAWALRPDDLCRRSGGRTARCDAHCALTVGSGGAAFAGLSLTSGSGGASV